MKQSLQQGTRFLLAGAAFLLTVWVICRRGAAAAAAPKDSEQTEE